eukprot:scaffold56201_cov63-Phaeocystis_antarctica.AAC.2
MRYRQEAAARHEMLDRRLAIGGCAVRPECGEAQRSLVEARCDVGVARHRHALERQPKVAHAAHRRRLTEHQ